MKIAVFCGSSSGNDIAYTDATKKLGKFLAQKNIDLVYGGGNVGLMGTIADAVMENGGKVYGVIPEKLEKKELSHTNITELTVVSNMHERKAMMENMADAFIVLPGGAGTLEEIFEVWTWAQLGFHHKPCAFLNVNGYYDKLFELIESMCEAKFLKQEYLDMLIKTDNQEKLLQEILEYVPPKDKW